MIGPAPMCSFCIHFNESTQGERCRAFPNGIPQQILEFEVDHRKPFPGDNGVQFEPIEGITEEELQVVFERYGR